VIKPSIEAHFDSTMFPWGDGMAEGETRGREIRLKSERNTPTYRATMAIRPYQSCVWKN
jgi:hypothetical protein